MTQLGSLAYRNSQAYQCFLVGPLQPLAEPYSTLVNMVHILLTDSRDKRIDLRLTVLLFFSDRPSHASCKEAIQIIERHPKMLGMEG
jgi:hypothetical protein